MPMMDLIHRNILSSSSLRGKRRENEIWRLEKQQQESIRAGRGTRTSNMFHNHKGSVDDRDHDQDLIEFIHGFLADVKKRSKFRDDTSTPTPTVNPTVNPTADPNPTTPSIVGLTREHLVLSVDNEFIQVPLALFVDTLAKAFEQKLTSTALCFVADASSSLGLDIIHQIVNDSNAGMALVQEPTWMANLAHFHTKFNPKELHQIVFALSRLDAWRVRDQALGQARTVVITLPGQGTTSSLLPLLQKVFPCERHVFIYDGAIDSVSRGLSFRTKWHHGLAYQAMDPIPSSLLEELKNLTHPKAEKLEAWMSSVDAFLKLKHSEKKTGYVPFVCRLGFIMGQVGKLGNGNQDQSELALLNLLQYMTGSKSSSRALALNQSVLEKAKMAVSHVRNTDDKDLKGNRNLSEYDRGVIEECAFAHKGILIENKTLIDTVQPKADWSLKAAKKLTSCACCMPGQGDEESDEEESADEGNGSDTGFGTGIGGDDAPKEYSATKGKYEKMNVRTNYVDGKAMFAFDPSKFTGGM